jgi:hypothetical protein
MAPQSQQQLGKHVIVYIYIYITLALGSPPFHLILSSPSPLSSLFVIPSQLGCLLNCLGHVIDGGGAGGDAVAGSEEDGIIAVPAGVRVLRQQPGEEGSVPGRSHPAGTPTGTVFARSAS